MTSRDSLQNDGQPNVCEVEKSIQCCLVGANRNKISVLQRQFFADFEGMDRQFSNSPTIGWSISSNLDGSHPPSTKIYTIDSRRFFGRGLNFSMDIIGQLPPSGNK